MMATSEGGAGRQQVFISGIGTLPQSLPICSQHSCSSAVIAIPGIRHRRSGVTSQKRIRSAVVNRRRHITSTFRILGLKQGNSKDLHRQAGYDKTSKGFTARTGTAWAVYEPPGNSSKNCSVGAHITSTYGSVSWSARALPLFFNSEVSTGTVSSELEIFAALTFEDTNPCLTQYRPSRARSIPWSKVSSPHHLEWAVCLSRRNSAGQAFSSALYRTMDTRRNSSEGKLQR